jgi:hypothetical protein
MRICIDSCVFIRGYNHEGSDAERLLRAIGPKVQVVINRLIAQEVTRNLSGREQARRFYAVFQDNPAAHIVYGPIPPAILARYVALGLRQKGDAIIGAFAEWMQVDYLISDNRYFLRELQTDAYRVASPAEFLAHWQQQSQT